MIRFNLVIEVLVVSRFRLLPKSERVALFQSRNRGTCRFKLENYGQTFHVVLFQSRNRGTCRFKPMNLSSRAYRLTSFNLVIEVLVVSRRVEHGQHTHCLSFQSRNRGTCRFKSTHIHLSGGRLKIGFNLVIEVLVVSSKNLVVMRVTDWIVSIS